MEQPRDRYDAAPLALLLELDSLIVGLGLGALYQNHYLLLGMSGTQQELLLGMGRTQQELLLGMGGRSRSCCLAWGDANCIARLQLIKRHRVRREGAMLCRN